MIRIPRAFGISTILVIVLLACGGTTSGVSGGETDGGPPVDAASGLDGSRSEVGSPSDASPDGPNALEVTCGAASCSRDGDAKSRQICCVTPGKPPQLKCTQELDITACDQGRRECDDAADCGGGNVCCAETSNDGKMSTHCMPSCITGAERWQVCKTSAECEPGIPCTKDICPRQAVDGFCVGAALPTGCR